MLSHRYLSTYIFSNLMGIHLSVAFSKVDVSALIASLVSVIARESVCDRMSTSWSVCVDIVVSWRRLGSGFMSRNGGCGNSEKWPMSADDGSIPL